MLVVTSLSSHVLKNSNKNNLWIAQRVKLIEQMSVRIDAQNTQIIEHIEQRVFKVLKSLSTLSNKEFSLLYKFSKHSFFKRYV